MNKKLSVALAAVAVFGWGSAGVMYYQYHHLQTVAHNGAVMMVKDLAYFDGAADQRDLLKMFAEDAAISDKSGRLAKKLEAVKVQYNAISDKAAKQG